MERTSAHCGADIAGVAMEILQPKQISQRQDHSAEIIPTVSSQEQMWSTQQQQQQRQLRQPQRQQQR